jgi:predicted DNA-binding protein
METARLVIIIPTDIKAALASLSEADGRSMSNYVVELIKKDIELKK